MLNAPGYLECGDVMAHTELHPGVSKPGTEAAGGARHRVPPKEDQLRGLADPQCSTTHTIITQPSLRCSMPNSGNRMS